MPFIGNQPALSYTSFAKQDFTTSATTSYTLDNPVANANELALFINFVRQEPTTAYSASGTSLTLTSATSASDDMYCVYLGKAVQTVNPPNASVGASQIVDSSIALGKLYATGTKDATTFLRGDNTFASAGGTNTPYFNAFSLSGQTLNHATETKKTFTDVTESSSGVFDLTNNKFTVTEAGKYFFSFNLLAYDTANELRRLDIWFKKNGTQKVKFSNNFNGNVSGRDFNLGGSFIFNASASEYFEMFVYQNTGDSGSIELRGASSEQSCYFGGFKIIE